MKKFLIALLMPLISLACARTKSRPEQTAEPMTAKSFYSFRMKSITGEMIDFSQYKGKKVLLVNVASKCGYTPQYAGLQELHEQYGDKVIVLGFPANNFGAQEPGTNPEIAAFCTDNYGVTFQLFEKISVKGEDQAELYKWLSSKEQNGWNDQAPSWNFCKYLVDEEGRLLKFYNSAVSPTGDEIVKML